MLEGYNAQSYLAGITERVRLGTLVTGVIYRYTGILSKTATTLDVLSGGRAYLGIGAGCSSARREVWVSPSPRQKNASSAGGDPADRPPDVVRRGSAVPW